MLEGVLGEEANLPVSKRHLKAPHPRLSLDGDTSKSAIMNDSKLSMKRVNTANSRHLTINSNPDAKAAGPDSQW